MKVKKQHFVKVVMALLMLFISNKAMLATTEAGIIHKVRLQLKWLHQFEFAGYYMAIEKGYYKEAGIEVELLEPKDSKSPIENVCEGNAEFGISASDVVTGRAQNKKVVVLASVFQQTPNILIAAKNSGINRARDINGKKIALESDAAEIIALLKNEGVTLSKDQVKPLGYEAKQLLNSEVDVISAYLTDEPFYLDSIGFQYNIISPQSGGIDFYGDVLFTTEQLIKTNPELVNSFRKASLLGWEYAMNHPYEAIYLTYNKYSKRHSINALQYEMMQTKKLIMPELIEIGYSNPGRWKDILLTYQDLKLVPEDQTIKGLLYSDYHKEDLNINWQLVGIFTIIISIITAIAWFFYRSSVKLKTEMARRISAETKLQELNTTLEDRINRRNDELKQINENLRLENEERARFEKLLEQTKDNYEIFFNSIGDPIFVYDLSGNIVHCNTAAGKRLEYSENELLGKTARFIHPAELGNETDIVVRNLVDKRTDVCRLPLITKSGEIFPVETKVTHGTWNGQPVLFSIYKDLSILELSERKFASAFQSSTAMMAISKVSDGKYVDINQEFIEATEYSREELIDKTNSELELFVDTKLRDTIINQVDNGIAIRKIEVKFRSKSGVVKTGLLSADTIYVGKERCLLTVTMDITDRKTAEEQIIQAREEAENANFAKSEFLSRMSHELRTPMNAILGFAQLLEMGELNRAQRKGVDHILRGGKHLLDLINEVLDISRIESGRLSLSPEPVRLREVLAEMIDTVIPLAQSRKVKINLIDSPDNNSYVKADRQRLKQVLLNLINNAIKYNRPEGNVKICTQIIEVPGNSLVTRISVTDTGLGIHKEDLSKLFNPFERIGAEQTDIEGSGLGLAVVKRLMEAMKGKVGVESEVGTGSTFWIELPHTESQLKVIAHSVNSDNTEITSAKQTGTILYIEDNNSNIELIEQVLSSQRSDIRLISNANGQLAVPLSIEHKPDLILLDLNLPDIHGSEVIKLLQENSNTKEIPVVVISADAMPQQINKLLQSGAKKYLTKPLEINELLVTIDTYLASEKSKN